MRVELRRHSVWLRSHLSQTQSKIMFECMKIVLIWFADLLSKVTTLVWCLSYFNFFYYCYYYFSRLFIASLLLSFIKHIIQYIVEPGELFYLLDSKTHACTAGIRLLFLATWRWVPSAIVATHVVYFHCIW